LNEDVIRVSGPLAEAFFELGGSLRVATSRAIEKALCFPLGGNVAL
jgi:hypothetical protein